MNNVAIVVLDTLRKDSFEEYFDWLPGTRYENAWAPSHWTVPVHGSLFTGKYPSEAGVYARSIDLDTDQTVLAERLSDAGLTTRGFSANPNISKKFSFDRGFGEFQWPWQMRQFNRIDLFEWSQALDLGAPKPIRYSRAIAECIKSDSATVASLIDGGRIKLSRVLRNQSESDDGATDILKYVRQTNFGDGEFLFLNLMEAHSPYTPPPEYSRAPDQAFSGIEETILESEIDPEQARDAYEGCVEYLSDMYCQIFDELSAEFDYVITLSDHGELFGEYGAWRHDYGLYPELTHVPLSIYDGSDGIERNQSVVSLTQVYHTVLDAAGVEDVDPDRSLLGTVPSEEPLTEYHGLTHNHKIETLEENGFDSETIATYDEPKYGFVTPEGTYAYEDVDGFTQRGDGDLERLERQLRSLREGLPEITRSNSEIEISTSAKDRLEDLGYV
jgi:arylsulfatase